MGRDRAHHACVDQCSICLHGEMHCMYGNCDVTPLGQQPDILLRFIGCADATSARKTWFVRGKAIEDGMHGTSTESEHGSSADKVLIKDKILKHAIVPESALGADLYLSSVTTVSDVEVSKDLQVAKVYISVFGDQRGKEIAIEGLKNAEKYVRMQLGRRMKIRRTPEVRFIEDDSFERGDRVLRILDRIKAERERKERGEATEYDSEDEEYGARLSNDEDGDLSESEDDDEKIIFVK